MTGAASDLHDFLQSASERLIGAFRRQAHETADPVVRLALSRGSLLRGPACFEALAKVERDLGIDLPADYKSFLRVSNGMVIPWINGQVAELLPVEAIMRFACADASAFAMWKEQGSLEPFAHLCEIPGDFVSLQENLPDVEVLKDAVLLSDVVNSGGLLLCPFPSSGPNVFEVWELEPWAGCVRYRNFSDFLRERIKASLAEWEREPGYP